MVVNASGFNVVMMFYKEEGVVQIPVLEALRVSALSINVTFTFYVLRSAL